MNKEELKIARKLAYQKAKKARDESPAFQALKQKYKEKRAELYRAKRDALKAQKKAARLLEIKAKDENLAQEAGLEQKLKLLSFD
jgi:hypothetical protein